MTTRSGSSNHTPVSEIIGELTPLDEAILSMLPVEGSKLGYQWLGPQVPQMTEQLNKDVPVEARATSEQISGRLTTLGKLGLVKRVIVQPSQQGKGTQITERGQAVLRLLQA